MYRQFEIPAMYCPLPIWSAAWSNNAVAVRPSIETVQDFTIDYQPDRKFFGISAQARTSIRTLFRARARSNDGRFRGEWEAAPRLGARRDIMQMHVLAGIAPENGEGASFVLTI